MAGVRSAQSLDSLYPQARKLQFELKMQMSYLDSGRTGGKTDTELQAEARGNLSQLEQILWQLESLVQASAKPAERDTWSKKLQQLRNETQTLGHTLEQHIYHANRRAGFDSNNNAMYAAQESESLQRSSQMVSDLTSLSQSVLGDLGEQRNRMKVRTDRQILPEVSILPFAMGQLTDGLLAWGQNVRTKLLDIANRLGLSSSLLRVIERRDTVDFWIVVAGMIFTLVFLYVCYAYATQS
ncbi:hypothetical protein BBJ28_00024693 [Nothophytophthora sp. Chile5]|nr:hypothetical protein BBJ28_00024693 [Nothophytophthora sp. Chile5]